MKWLQEAPQIQIDLKGSLKWTGAYELLHVTNTQLICKIEHYKLIVEAENIHIKRLDLDFLFLIMMDIQFIRLVANYEKNN